MTPNSEPIKRKRLTRQVLDSSSAESEIEDNSHLVVYIETKEYAILGDSQEKFSKLDKAIGTVLQKKGALSCTYLKKRFTKSHEIKVDKV